MEFLLLQNNAGNRIFFQCFLTKKTYGTTKVTFFVISTINKLGTIGGYYAASNKVLSLKSLKGKEGRNIDIFVFYF